MRPAALCALALVVACRAPDYVAWRVSYSQHENDWLGEGARDSGRILIGPEFGWDTGERRAARIQQRELAVRRDAREGPGRDTGETIALIHPGHRGNAAPDLPNAGTVSDASWLESILGVAAKYGLPPFLVLLLALAAFVAWLRWGRGGKPGAPSKSKNPDHGE